MEQVDDRRAAGEQAVRRQAGEHPGLVRARWYARQQVLDHPTNSSVLTLGAGSSN
ncbi:hypothetical protein [Massilia phosphatilytica]